MRLYLSKLCVCVSSSLPPQLSFVFAEFPMRFFIHGLLQKYDHTLFHVQDCGKSQIFYALCTPSNVYQLYISNTSLDNNDKNVIIIVTRVCQGISHRYDMKSIMLFLFIYITPTRCKFHWHPHGVQQHSAEEPPTLPAAHPGGEYSHGGCLPRHDHSKTPPPHPTSSTPLVGHIYLLDM